MEHVPNRATPHSVPLRGYRIDYAPNKFTGNLEATVGVVGQKTPRYGQATTANWDESYGHSTYDHFVPPAYVTKHVNKTLKPKGN